MAQKDVRHRQGYYIGIGISIGMAIGAGLGLIFDNAGAGIGIGVALGTVIGSLLERRNRDKLRPLTEPEVRRVWRSIIIGLGVVALLAIILILVSLFKFR